MNAIHPPETAHPPSPRLLAEAFTDMPQALPRATVIDRIALRIGLRLLLWSTRSIADDARSRQQRDLLRIATEARAEHGEAVARAHLRGAQTTFLR